VNYSLDLLEQAAQYIEVRRDTIMTKSISLGYQVMLKQDLLKEGESFKLGRATLKSTDILRCISVDGEHRVFVNQRTGTAYCFAMPVLAAKFNAIGFDGLEEIAL
jgi:hypothetical protein